MKSTQGSAYIFVLVIASAIFLMLSSAVKMTAYEADISHAYINNSNLHYLSESGVYKALGVIDEIILLTDAEDGDARKIELADKFLRSYTGIGSEYCELISYDIETLQRAGTYMTYNVTVYIKADYNDPSYTIMSVAKNQNASVKIIGLAELEFDGVARARLTTIKRMD